MILRYCFIVILYSGMICKSIPADQSGTELESKIRLLTLHRWHEEKRQELLKGWSGLNDTDILQSLMDQIAEHVVENGPTAELNNSLHYLLEKMQVPTEQVVSMAMESVKREYGSAARAVRYFGILSIYDEDPRVVPFFSKYLDDQRPVNRRPRKPGGDYHTPIGRFCDNAEGAIKRYLERKGLFKPGDPGYGDAGGESTYEAADANIAALKMVLKRHNLLAGAAPASNGETGPPPKTTQVTSELGGTLPAGVPNPGVSDTGVVLTDKGTPRSPIWIWVALAIAGLCALFRWVSNRRP